MKTNDNSHSEQPSFQCQSANTTVLHENNAASSKSLVRRALQTSLNHGSTNRSTIGKAVNNVSKNNSFGWPRQNEFEDR